MDFSLIPIDYLSEIGRVDGLQWRFENQNQYPFEYSSHAIDSATLAGSINSLNWWFDHRKDLQLKYDTIDVSYKTNYPKQRQVIKWWISKRDYFGEIKFSSYVLKLFSLKGDFTGESANAYSTMPDRAAVL